MQDVTEEKKRAVLIGVGAGIKLEYLKIGEGHRTQQETLKWCIDLAYASHPEHHPAGGAA